MNDMKRLSAEQLRRRCDPEAFSFSSTEDLPQLEGVIGQDRAMNALSFGVEIKSQGYHMYALGPIGTGKTTTIRKYLEKDAKERPVPDDWLYVNNFEDQDKPRALRLPAGMGREFKEDMEQFVKELETDVPQAFESKEYQEEQGKIDQEFQQRSKDIVQEAEKKAADRGLKLIQTPQGLGTFPVEKGEVMSPEQMRQLDEERRREIEGRQEELQSDLREMMQRLQELQKERRERTNELDRRIVGFAIDHVIDELKEKYEKHQAVLDFLTAARSYLLKNVTAFKQIKQMEQASSQQKMGMAAMMGGKQPSFDEYRVNLIVDNSKTAGAPLVLEKNPIGPNLIGRIEHQGQFGALVTNFSMIRGGSLHRANGGYLMVDAFEVLTKPLAWQVLKRALKNEEVVIESMGAAYGALTTHTLEPEPIPLDIKVILIGDPFLYYMLYRMDHDFQELFKVKADFEVRMEWTPETEESYAQFIGGVCREEGLKHFSPSGVARVVEHGARMASHRDKLATRFADVVDVIRQSAYWAGKNGNGLVEAEDVRKALEERVYRSNRLEEIVQEMIEEGTILIQTEGKVKGQVNGLSVMPLGDYSFGKPSRITAQTYVGDSGVVNIEREAKLSGPIYNKGAMILAGYLGGKYATDIPLALSASLAFEQVYEEIEGDSASSAELYALLSSLSGYPVRQDLAVTGSVNQHGEVQAIGGVNQKIEGFFDVCKTKGLTGTQGVLIPASNLKHLMLRERVIEAVKEGRFHIYPVSTIDEGIELLTGVEAGKRLEDGGYPENTINGAVKRRVVELAEKAKAFSGRKKRGEREE